VTTALGCSHGELVSEGSIGDWPSDVLIVLDDDIASDVDARLRGLIRGLVTGEVDDDGVQDVWAAPLQRVALSNIADAQLAAQAWRCATKGGSASSCPAHPLPFVRYRWAPYALEEDVDGFVERVMCLRTANAPACSSTADPDEKPFFEHMPQLLLITNRDLCDPMDPVGTCNDALDQLVRAAVDMERPSPLFKLVAGLPRDAATFAAWEAADDANEFLGRLLRNPRVAQDPKTDVCEGEGGLRAKPSPRLLSALVNHAEGALSVCAGDYRPVLEMIDCGGFAADFGSVSFPDRIAKRADGSLDCTLQEVLPLEGPVTHCAQLAPFGRAAEPLRIEDGREVCLLAQTTEPAGGAHEGYGWYLSTDGWHLPFASRGGFAPPCTGWIGGGRALAVRRGTEFIPASTLRLRCTTTADESVVPSCENQGS
jgi:hypothetical protein